MSDYVFAFLGRILPALLLVTLAWAAWALWYTARELWVRLDARRHISRWLFGPRNR